MEDKQLIFMACISIELEQVACYLEGYGKESISEVRNKSEESKN